MKHKNILLLCFVIFVYGEIFSQITLRGCTTNGLGLQDFTLNNTGTVNDGGTIRNTYESTPLNFAQGCPAGVCEVRIIWNSSGSRWEIQLDNDGPAGAPDYTSATLYFNSNPSVPNPPDLTLGTWTDGAGGSCPVGELTTLSGDVQNTTTLPVDLIQFNGKSVQNQIQLSWQTATEVNNDYFQIERRDNSNNFVSLDTILGNGNSSDLVSYQFMDESPLPDDNYYRLKQVDLDGKFQYSHVIKVNINSTSNYCSEFYPNPSSNKITRLNYYSLEKGKVEIAVFDLSGRLLIKKKKDLALGKNQLEFDFRTLSAGIKKVMIGTPTNVFYRKLILL